MMPRGASLLCSTCHFFLSGKYMHVYIYIIHAYMYVYAYIYMYIHAYMYDSALRALSSLRGLRGAPEVPPLCRETQSLGQQKNTYMHVYTYIYTEGSED